MDEGMIVEETHRRSWQSENERTQSFLSKVL